MSGFRDYAESAASYITVVEGDFYPDSLSMAIPIYESFLAEFGGLIRESSDSQDLLRRISGSTPKRRIQLLRIFRKYVSPDTPVEMLKKKTMIEEICRDFGAKFRELSVVREKFSSRPNPDEALIAVLNEYRDRGQKGYELSEAFFAWFEAAFGDSYSIEGPVRAGKDVNLHDHLPEYPKDRRPVDAIGTPIGSTEPSLVVLIRYDSDRGGAQEDDRTSGYRNVVEEVLGYARKTKRDIRLLFVNDGPGLLLGSMWKDYSEIEEMVPGRIMVATLKMLPERLSLEWLVASESS